ncbi:MAG: ATP-binding cassette domain-containing protein [Chloroflexota bacterium]|nr:ATP-binding cassette domain-containing protein [Chloroflexota bacterium]
MDETRDPWLPYSGRRCSLPVPGMPAVEVAAAQVAYPGADTLALENISLRVPVAARVALVGPNGSGKSTLLKAIAGLVALRAGEIHIYGQVIGACHHRVAYLPQRGDVDWRFPISVRKLVLTGRYVHLGWMRRPGAYDREVADAALAHLGLQTLAGRQIGQLSGGQQQRALLARALAQQADLLLLDEPLNAVDAETREVVARVLAELKRQGRTLLVATHDLGRLEADFDGAVYLHAGREVPPPPGSFRGIAVGQEPVWSG